MSDTPNYKETTVSGEKWTRAAQVEIDNTYGKSPSIAFVETDIMNISGDYVVQHVATLTAEFDPENQLHIDIYNKLNELYVLLREARDAEISA